MQMEKVRQSNVQKEYDIEAKRLMVENVKVSQGIFFGIFDWGLKASRQPFKEYRSTELMKLNRPKTSNIQVGIE